MSGEGAGLWTISYMVVHFKNWRTPAEGTKKMRMLPVMLALTLAILPVLAQTVSAGAPVATVDGGAVRGNVADGVAMFKGIPYAAPPVGPLRWRAPQPVTRWSGARAATNFGSDCMQVPFPSDAAPLGTPPAEDCLYMNVWQPIAKGTKRPVLVWIYGGGFVNGGSSPAVYDGAAFAKRGLVFVSFNYRVGRFGFFAHPALTAAHEGPLGNYTFLDQIAALEWVKRNIAAFGGDPTQITLMGESAGGSSVLNLMASPMAHGLFQRAIVMSGGGRALPGGRPLHDGDAAHPSAEQVGLNFAHSVGVEGSGPDALAALRALPADAVRGDLNMATARKSDPPTYVGGPIIDGRIVVGDTDDAMRRGTAARIPMMVGTTSADAGTGSARSKDTLYATFGADATEARAAYDPTGQRDVADAAAAVARDHMMTEPARFVAKQTVAAGQPAWVYRFGYVATSMRSQWKGAPHATDIPFFFDTVAVKYGTALTPEDEQAARLANAYFSAFALTGTPHPAGLPAWPAFDAGQDRILLITDDAKAEALADPLRKQLDIQEKQQK
jgi:para-nitrobenzyl esterase